MDIDTLTIKEARDAVQRGKEVAALLTGQRVANEPAAGDLVENHGLQIVILDRGWVYVGNVTIEGNWCVIQNAKCVRRWGTDDGLGQLASKGPQPETKLEVTGTVKANMRAVIGLIGCEASKWK
jgi:hypothetical protein